MKPRPLPDPDERWQALLRQAQADQAPPVHLPSLFHAIRAASTTEPQGWSAEFLAVFGSSRITRACLGTALLVAGVATWQVWELWQTLPWAELVLVAGGSS